MDWNITIARAAADSGLSAAVQAATITAAVAILALVVNAIVNVVLTNKRIRVDQALAERKVSTDIDLAEKRVASDIALAERKFRLDRDMKLWDRQSSYGEEVLAAAYRAKAVFHAARSPLSLAGEGRTRPVDDTEEPDLAAQKNAAFAPMERLGRELEFINEFSAKRWKFTALFGTGAETAFASFIQSYNEIQRATFELLEEMDRKANDIGTDRARSVELRRIIWWGKDGEDEIERRHDQAVALIETLVRPALSALPDE